MASVTTTTTTTSIINLANLARLNQLTIDTIKQAKQEQLTQDKWYGHNTLNWACGFSHIDIIETLIVEKELNVNERSGRNSNTTPLMFAISCRRWDVVDLLLKHNATALPFEGEEYHIIHEAACNGAPLDTIAALIYAGGNYKLVNDLGKTPQDMANESGYPQIATFLENWKDTGTKAARFLA
jgi:ankyrin repeat protein